jgi:hypothetical protein
MFLIKTVRKNVDDVDDEELGLALVFGFLGGGPFR